MIFKEREDNPFFYDPDAEQEYKSRGSLRDRYEIYLENTDDDEPMSFDEWLNN